MPHPAIENNTAFFADALHLVDEEFEPWLTLVVKATFDVQPGGTLAVSAEQQPVKTAGEFQDPEAEISSYRYEPEVAPIKLATDVAFVGHAHAPKARTNQMDIGFQVGALVKSLRVVGERMWFRSLGELNLTSPQPFERMPICYERAFGGWDHSVPEEGKHSFEPRNPVGRGYHSRRGKAREGVYAPNIEDLRHPIQSQYDTPPPAGLGFISPNWQPRVGFAGTYDDAWQENRFPLLPTDFDRRFHNAASPGLLAKGFLRGDENVHTVGLSPEGRMSFRLPGVPPPSVRVSLVDSTDHRPQANLDTVIVDLDDRKLFMLWRASMPLPDGPHDVRGIEYDCPASLTLPRAEMVTGPALAANQAR
ncbi:MAG: DUF2169 domain-containing protein [Deltaproteobacteria bacterium]|nr:DUF2169 domain-containing protein [Deltaproteobacteria bacterium]